MEFYNMNDNMTFNYDNMSHFNHIDLFGFLAALLTTIAFLPQLYKTWKTKSANDVSLIMLILFITGLICDETYHIKLAIADACKYLF